MEAENNAFWLSGVVNCGSVAEALDYAQPGYAPAPTDIGIDYVPRADTSRLLADRIAEFVDTVGINFEVLSLDGYIDEGAKMEPGFPRSLIDAPEGFKIDNKRQEKSVIVPIEAIVRNQLDVLIEALKTFEFVKVYGVTRIVGYYSRVTNWNRSKIGELRDRQKGSYGVSSVAQGHTEK